MLDGNSLEMENNNLCFWTCVTVKDGEEEVIMDKDAYGSGAFLINSR